MKRITTMALAALGLLASLLTLAAQPTAFTYQGRLGDHGAPANGSYDLAFALYDAPAAGTAVGLPVTVSPVSVSNGLFTVTLDFGTAAFSGADRWLEISVSPTGSGLPPMILQPRQPLTSTPYAVRAREANTAAIAENVNAGAVGASALQAGAVDSVSIADGAVTEADLGAALRGSTFWRLDGNAGTTPGAHYLGTTDNQALEFRVHARRGLRLEPSLHDGVNVVGGWAGNQVGAGVVGATIGGGGAGDWFGSAFTNRVDASGGTIAGGDQNTVGADSDDATIGGGFGNRIREFSWNATVGGGTGNTIGDFCLHSTIGGGQANSIEGSERATISGGSGNQIELFAHEATIGGGTGNTIEGSAYAATIAGGDANAVRADCQDATISGGSGNEIQGGAWHATVGGGSGNLIAASSASIGGGVNHRIEGLAGTIGGGGSNLIQTNAFDGTIGGGQGNTIASRASFATIGGGRGNFLGTNASFSTIAGGSSNVVAPGGLFATIAGGRANTATNFAFAAGCRAKAVHSGAFVWGDSTDADLASASADSVTLRAAGGYRLFSDPAASTGVSLAAGDGSWTTLSDRTAKENFAAVNPEEILAKVAALSVLTWNYRSQDSAIRHLGPTAQDFKAAFALGATDTGIATVDADGVALAAIQGLNQKLTEREAALRRELDQKASEITDLKARLAKLEQLINAKPCNRP